MRGSWFETMRGSHILLVPASVPAVSLEREKAAKQQEDDGTAGDQAAALADFGRNRRETDREKHSSKTAEDGEAAKHRDQHRPAAAPDIVSANDRKPGDEQESAGHENERRIAGNLLHHRGERAEIEQHCHRDREERG